MATNPSGGTSRSLIDRAKNIIMSPKLEWPVIDAEPSTIGGIYTSYVAILAAIPPLCMAIGLFLMGNGFFHFSPSFIIGQAIVTYVLSLIGIYIFALVMEALAPSFGGTKDRLKAFKLVAYSWTAAWLVGVFFIIPFLGILAILGLYSFYLLYLGVPVLMKVPEDKSVVYTIVAVIVGIVIYAIISTITTRLMYAMVPPVNTITLSYPG